VGKILPLHYQNYYTESLF